MRDNYSIALIISASLCIPYFSGCQHTCDFSINNRLLDSASLRSGALFEWSCPSYEGGDGTSLDQAVILRGISVKSMAREAKKNWLNIHYPDHVIYEVKHQISRFRVFDIISIEKQSGEKLLDVYFDVTEAVTKPSLGMWFFLYDNNEEYVAGMINEDYVFSTYSGPEPWEYLIGRNSGTLIYQIDDEVENGLLAIGEFKDGVKNGIWKYERREGSRHVKYNMGTNISEKWEKALQTIP